MIFTEIFHFAFRGREAFVLTGLALDGCLFGFTWSYAKVVIQSEVQCRIQEYKARKARLEADRNDDALRQKWAGNVDPEYRK